MSKREAVKARFAERLQFYRQQTGLSPSELAEELGVSKGAVSAWEHGRNLPDGSHLLHLAEVLHVPLIQLFETPEDDLEGIVEVYANQTEANEPIFNFIKQNKPSEMFLIQYVSVNVMEVIRTFNQYAKSEKSAQIYLLIKYPGTKPVDEGEGLELKKRGIHTVDKYQYDKIRVQLATLLERENGLYNVELNIRCYHAPGAMRALYIGHPPGQELRSLLKNQNIDRADIGLLSMSLSRYTGQLGGVIGHLNPLIHVNSNTKKGKLLYSLFEKTFIDLWNDSIPGQEVLSDMEKR